MVPQMPTLADQPTAAPLRTSTDECLLHRLAHGNLDALDLLYTRYARPIFTLAVRVLGDDADDDEVTPYAAFCGAWGSA
jgi:hypothetical protein